MATGRSVIPAWTGRTERVRANGHMLRPAGYVGAKEQERRRQAVL